MMNDGLSLLYKRTTLDIEYDLVLRIPLTRDSRGK